MKIKTTKKRTVLTVFIAIACAMILGGCTTAQLEAWQSIADGLMMMGGAAGGTPYYPNTQNRGYAPNAAYSEGY